MPVSGTSSTTLVALVFVLHAPLSHGTSNGLQPVPSPGPVSLAVSDVRTIDGVVEFTITNPTTKTATAWVVEFGPPTDDGQARGRMSTDCHTQRILPGAAARTTPEGVGTGCPLPPGARAVVRGTGPSGLLDARAVAAVFDEGASEGDVVRLLARREAEASACDKWLAIIDTALSSDNDVAVSLLRMKLDAAGASPDERVATELIQQLLARLAEGRSVALRDELKFFADYLRRVRREATRHLPRVAGGGRRRDSVQGGLRS